MHMFTDTFQVAFPAFRRRCCRKSPRPRRDLAGSRRHACSTHARANRPHTRTHARAHARTHAHTHAHTHLPVLIWLAAGGRANRNTCKQPARMRARTHARHTQAFTLADLAGSRRQACTHVQTRLHTLPHTLTAHPHTHLSQPTPPPPPRPGCHAAGHRDPWRQAPHAVRRPQQRSPRCAPRMHVRALPARGGGAPTHPLQDWLGPSSDIVVCRAASHRSACLCGRQKIMQQTATDNMT